MIELANDSEPCLKRENLQSSNPLLTLSFAQRDRVPLTAHGQHVMSHLEKLRARSSQVSTPPSVFEIGPNVSTFVLVTDSKTRLRGERSLLHCHSCSCESYLDSELLMTF